MARSVLVVEDDPDARTLVSTVLGLAGFQVREAANGMQGLESARAAHPCVILLDLMMPVMDGYEFRKKQLNDPDLADVPVVCLTARHDARDICRALGISDILQKPLEIDTLVGLVEAYCREMA